MYLVAHIVLITLLTITFQLNAAQLYQCGDNSFQQTPCDDGVEQKQLKIKVPKKSTPKVKAALPNNIAEGAPQVVFGLGGDDQVRRDEAIKARIEKQKNQSIAKLKSDYNFAKRRCSTAKKNIKANNKRIVASCKKRRDTFCEEGAEKIAKKNLWSAQKQQMSSRNRNWRPESEYGDFGSKEYCAEANRYKKQLREQYKVYVY